MSVPFVHSGYERIENDNYQTIDERCLRALLDNFKINSFCDPFSEEGSALVRQAREIDIEAHEGKIFNYLKTPWIVTNPPYDRGTINSHMWDMIEMVERELVAGVAVLLRTQFDHAKSRWEMFNRDSYWGQIKLMFRPWWSSERKSSPIHNYVWHIWSDIPRGTLSQVAYWRE